MLYIIFWKVGLLKAYTKGIIFLKYIMNIFIIIRQTSSDSPSGDLFSIIFSNDNRSLSEWTIRKMILQLFPVCLDGS